MPSTYAHYRMGQEVIKQISAPCPRHHYETLRGTEATGDSEQFQASGCHFEKCEKREENLPVPAGIFLLHRWRLHDH